GSVLGLSAVTTLTGSDSTESVYFNLANVNVQASIGGVDKLHHLTQIIDPSTGNLDTRSVNLSADGSGSRIDAASLTSFQDRSGEIGRASCRERDDGRVDTALVTALEKIKLSVSGTTNSKETVRLSSL